MEIPKKEMKVIILDDNVLSLSLYAGEFPENFKEITEGIKKVNSQARVKGDGHSLKDFILSSTKIKRNMSQVTMRKELILSMLPKDINSILDIGNFRDLYSDYNVTTLDYQGKTDIKQDLNKNQKLPFKDNSIDIIILNQILEHIGDVNELVNEVKRVSKKYIFIGLPNELNWKARIRFLLGIPSWKGYLPFFHKHFFTIKEIEKFVVDFFGDYIHKEYYEPSRYKWFPTFLNIFLAKTLPSLFCKEVYYLIKTESINNANNGGESNG